jgi:hypothetical protein
MRESQNKLLMQDFAILAGPSSVRISAIAVQLVVLQPVRLDGDPRRAAASLRPLDRA